MSEPIRKHVQVACDVARAFAVFTAEIDRWWPASHRRLRGRVILEAGLGGRFLEQGPDGEEAVLGHVLGWEPPVRLAYSWFSGADLGPTRVDVRFVASGDGTRVEVIHSEGESGLGPAWSERAQRFDRAWTAVLAAFTAFLGPTAA